MGISFVHISFKYKNTQIVAYYCTKFLRLVRNNYMIQKFIADHDLIVHILFKSVKVDTEDNCYLN